MADSPKNMAASVKARLLTMSREQGRAFDLLLVRFALERLLFRLSLSPHRDNYVLKGGMLVTQWLKHDNRELATSISSASARTTRHRSQRSSPRS